MQITLTSRGLSRAPAATFKPRINLRSAESAEDVRKFGPLVVVRYGVMPDGSEISLGRTVDRDLPHATEQYWRRLFLNGYLSWMPRPLRWVVKKVYPVQVKGYEMTPLPPLENTLIGVSSRPAAPRTRDLAKG